MRTLKKSEIKRVRGGTCGLATALQHVKSEDALRKLRRNFLKICAPD